MVTSVKHLGSSSTRPLNVRMRPDLTICEHRYQGQAAWVIKDPVGLKYFRFRDEEYALLTMLDGQTSLDDLKKRYETRFPPQKITLPEITHFVGTLHKNNLVLAQLPDQGLQLKRRRDERRRQDLIGTLSNLLAIRFRGVDPQRFLTWLLPYVQWMFSLPAMIACLTLGLAAVSLVTVQFETFRARLPAFHEFFAACNWIYLALALAVTKVLHELGHGMTCRRFGGECHEIGVLLLVFTPSLYCDVSDSSMLKSKWQRAAIGAAGMYVELVLASLATFIWWYSSPGLLNHLMLSVMFVCSVSTLAFNANPLLRYDGYYILADLLEIPNLRQKATAIVTRKLGAWCLGLEEPHDRYLPRAHHGWFALYTIAAVIYRWVVVLAVLGFLYKVLEPYGLKAIGQMFALAAVVGLVGQPLWSLKKHFSVPGRWQEVHPPRLILTIALAGLLLVGILTIPLPHRVYVPLEVQTHDAAQVFVEVPGRIMRTLVQPGDSVAAGQVLAELDNLDTRLEIAKLQGQCDESRAALTTMRRQRLARGAAGKEAEEQIAETEATLKSNERQLAERADELTLLTLRSPRVGTVMPPALVNGTPQVDGKLPGWSGTPLEQRNRGAWLAAGQSLCLVGDARKYEAVLIVDQADIAQVRPGQQVLLKLDQAAGATIRGMIAEVSQVNLKASSQRLSVKHGGDLDTRADQATGQEKPASPSYQARVLLDDPQGTLRLGLRGEARIEVASETLARRLWRSLARTFYL